MRLRVFQFQQIPLHPYPNPRAYPVLAVCWHKNLSSSFPHYVASKYSLASPQSVLGNLAANANCGGRPDPLRRAGFTVPPRLRLLPHEIPDHLQRQLVRDEPPVGRVSERHRHQRREQHRDLLRRAVILKGQSGSRCMSVGALPQHSMSWFAGHSSANAPMNSTVWSSRSSSSPAVARALSLLLARRVRRRLARLSPLLRLRPVGDGAVPFARAQRQDEGQQVVRFHAKVWGRQRVLRHLRPEPRGGVEQPEHRAGDADKVWGQGPRAAAAGSWSTGILNVASV